MDVRFQPNEEKFYNLNVALSKMFVKSLYVWEVLLVVKVVLKVFFLMKLFDLWATWCHF